MKPLIEILEEERMLMLKLDTIYRHLTKHNDMDVINRLDIQRNKLESKLANIRSEIREYVNEL